MIPSSLLRVSLLFPARQQSAVGSPPAGGQHGPATSVGPNWPRRTRRLPLVRRTQCRRHARQGLRWGRELSREGDVAQPGDAEHRGVNAVALQAAVAKDIPGLHPREDVLDACPDLAVGGVVFLLPCRQFGLAAFAAVRHEQADALVAAVCDGRGLADGGLRTGKFPRLAIVAVVGDRPADGDDDESSVGVDDDLVVGQVPVVLRLLGNRMIPRGGQGAIDDQRSVLTEPLTGQERERRW